MMTYCRYSDLDYTCDLHVIHSPDGVTVMTAVGRIDESALGPRPVLAEYVGTEGRKAWLRDSAEYHEAVFNAGRIRILSPLAGRVFTFPETGGAAEFIDTRLRVAGFRFPQSLVADLRAVAAA